MGTFFKYKYAYWAVMLMGILLPWGDLAKLPLLGANFGLSTILGLYIVAFGFVSGFLLRGLSRWRGAIALFVLGVITMFTAMFAEFGPSKVGGFYLSIKLILYASIAVTFLQMPLTREDLLRLLRFIAYSGSIVIVLSLIDRVTPITVPKFNLSLGNVKTGQAGFFVKDMCGPFANRSAFATYLSLYLPVIFGLAQMPQQRIFVRVFCLLMTPLALITIMLASSRGLFLGVFAAFGYFFYTTYGPKKLLQLAGALMALVITLVVFRVANPIGFEAFLIRFTSIFTAESIVESNNLGREFRMEMVRLVLRDLASNPLGQGFGKVYSPAAMAFKNLHNSYFEFLKAAGPLGIVLALIAFSPLIKGIFRPRDVEISRIFYASLLCLSVYNMTHSQWPFAMMWVYIGICVKFVGHGPIYPRWVSTPLPSAGNLVHRM